MRILVSCGRRGEKSEEQWKQRGSCVARYYTLPVPATTPDATVRVHATEFEGRTARRDATPAAGVLRSTKVSTEGVSIGGGSGRESARSPRSEKPGSEPRPDGWIGTLIERPRGRGLRPRSVPAVHTSTPSRTVVESPRPRGLVVQTLLQFKLPGFISESVIM